LAIEKGSNLVGYDEDLVGLTCFPGGAGLFQHGGVAIRSERRERAKYMYKQSPLAAYLVALIFLPSVVISGQSTAKQVSPPLKAVAVLHPTTGNNVTGTVTFTEVEDGVRVDAAITGLTPGKHGFHVHESGDCSAPDAGSAGAHFNPTNKQHGGADSLERHVGDMGNIEADASGEAKLNYLDHRMSLGNDRRSIIGRAVIVHAKPDDLKTQPSGDSGDRVACGVIGRAKSDEKQ